MEPCQKSQLAICSSSLYNCQYLHRHAPHHLQKPLKLELHLQVMVVTWHAACCKPQGNISRCLTQAGLVVAEVFSVNSHPKSDRLRVCSVDYGHDVAQVVTNAAEVATGMKVIFAVRLLHSICILYAILHIPNVQTATCFEARL